MEKSLSFFSQAGGLSGAQYRRQTDELHGADALTVLSESTLLDDLFGTSVAELWQLRVVLVLIESR